MNLFLSRGCDFITTFCMCSKKILKFAMLQPMSAFCSPQCVSNKYIFTCIILFWIKSVQVNSKFFSEILLKLVLNTNQSD